LKLIRVENRAECRLARFQTQAATATHFSRAFKAKHGMSPHAFMDAQHFNDCAEVCSDGTGAGIDSAV